MAGSVHGSLSDALRDRVSAYLLGGMAESEAERFEAHLLRCDVCREAVEGMKPTIEELLLSAPPCDPPAGVRDRVLARYREEQPVARLDPAGRWVPTDVPGIELLPLWHDIPRAHNTFLVRMRPGTALPFHRHLGPEDCHVVEGDLWEGALEVGAGGSLPKEAGTEHTVSTRGGCLMIMVVRVGVERVASEDAPS